MVLENSRNRVLLLRLQHEPDNLDVNQTCLANYWDIPSTHEELRLNQSATDWYRCSNKCGVMDTAIKRLRFWKVKELENFKLLGTRYRETNAAIQSLNLSVKWLVSRRTVDWSPFRNFRANSQKLKYAICRSKASVTSKIKFFEKLVNS